jgi:hypothetical protein
MWKPAAALGSAHAQYRLASSYDNDDNERDDYDQFQMPLRRLPRYRASALQGNATLRVVYDELDISFPQSKVFISTYLYVMVLSWICFM